MVRNFHSIRSAVSPLETNPPPVIDADAVLTFPISLQGFQPITRRHSQIIQLPGTVQILKFAARRVLNVWRQTSRPFSAKDSFGFRTGKAENHQAILSRDDNKSTFERARSGCQKTPGSSPLLEIASDCVQEAGK
jgi:hypothetical protein